jgi:hypothetical protein
MRRDACLLAALLASLLATAAVRATGDLPDTGISPQTLQHVRTTDARFSALIAEGMRRSPTVRSLVDRLDRSTMFVYVDYRPLPGNLSGRLTFLGGGDRWRYVRVEIECRQSVVDQIAALGHELQHAVEIADAAAAVDPPSIRALYGAIGFALDDSGQRFETDTAKGAGSRVRRELAHGLRTTSSDAQ